MQGENFAKLFQVEDMQVLITKDFEEDTATIREQTDFVDIRPSLTFGFESEEDRDEAFENYGQEQAESFIKTIKKIIEE